MLALLFIAQPLTFFLNNLQPVREAISYRGLFTAGWFGMREKQCSRLEIYDCLRASEHAFFIESFPDAGSSQKMAVMI